VPFDIDRTLIEIDQIPIGDAKHGREEEKSVATAYPGVKKGAIFEEFEEPARRKPKTAVIGAAAGILILAAAGFLIFKPKKSNPSPSDNMAAVEESLAAGTVSQPPDAKPYPDTAGAELRSEPKKTVKPAPEKPVEIGAPIQPPTPTEGALVALRDEPAVNPPASSLTPSEASGATQTAAAAVQEPESAPQGSPNAAGESPTAEPATP
jgi:hypothetical protein